MATHTASPERIALKEQMLKSHFLRTDPRRRYFCGHIRVQSIEINNRGKCNLVCNVTFTPYFRSVQAWHHLPHFFWNLNSFISLFLFIWPPPFFFLAKKAQKIIFLELVIVLTTGQSLCFTLRGRRELYSKNGIVSIQLSSKSALCFPSSPWCFC